MLLSQRGGRIYSPGLSIIPWRPCLIVALSAFFGAWPLFGWQVQISHRRRWNCSPDMT